MADRLREPDSQLQALQETFIHEALSRNRHSGATARKHVGRGKQSEISVDATKKDDRNGGAAHRDDEETPCFGETEPSEPSIDPGLAEQIKNLKAVRDLEHMLSKARHALHMSMKRSRRKQEDHVRQAKVHHEQKKGSTVNSEWAEREHPTKPMVRLKKRDVLELVDLYFYSHRSRFLCESTDASPTPLQLEDYGFETSEDSTLSINRDVDLVRDQEGTPVSPLYHVEAEIKAKKLHEIEVLQRLVDLLLDDYSALKDIFEAYCALPQPGVLYLPGAVIRLFLQRMATPWRKSETAMLRYLSVLDDMQAVRLPITAWEWSSAIHLAGRSFGHVTNSDVAAAFRIWHQMEKDHGIKARAVTFNILFDIAVKADKFVLAEEILAEMHRRGFRLNRLGRVGIIYYYGKKGDGDAVRKAYRDFVEAGEIVDTLVLNCVMASLINAQEPTAAELLYERMKGMRENRRMADNEDEKKARLGRYPLPRPNRIGNEMASNSLGKVLLNASRLQTILPRHHQALQDSMPLVPDQITFRTLMSYHVMTSGNIDRLTVLLDDMTQQFGLPMTHTTFRYLFMGFAMHGGSDNSTATWTGQRLRIAWAACVVCMRPGRGQDDEDAKSSDKHSWLDLPSVKDAEAMGAVEEAPVSNKRAKAAKPAKPSAWKSFIKHFTSPLPEVYEFDLAAGSAKGPRPGGEDDEQSGWEYTLPRVGLRPQSGTAVEADSLPQVRPTKQMVLWTIRAFARCTRSRSSLEEVWHEFSQVWHPTDMDDKAVAIRELRRALRYCDTHSPR
jgi:pentatricopeptide repeat protein